MTSYLKLCINKLKVYNDEFRVQLVLTVPLFLAQISMVTMGFFDMVMTGAVGVTDMAAVALGGSIWIPLLFFCQGILRALHPAVSKLRGEGKLNDTVYILRQGIILAVIISCFLIPVVYVISFVLQFTSIESHLVTLVVKYLHAISWGGPGYLCFIAIQCYLEGLGYTRPSMITSILGLLLNIIYNAIFIWGWLGVPALGGVGAGVATGIVYWSMLFIILFYLFMMKNISLLVHTSIKGWIDLGIIKQLVKVGFPGGLALFVEVTMFLVIGLFIAPLGAVIVAGHQVALNFSTLAFMFPYALSITTTIRVGYYIGRRSFNMIRVVSIVSLFLAFFLSLITAFITVVFRHEIARLYNNDPEVLMLVKELMLVAAMYQCLDAIQVVTMGILRGYNDTKVVLLIAFVSYWVSALPLGYILGMTNILVQPMGVKGFWLAFLVGILFATILGLFRMWFLEHKLNTTVAMR